MVKMCDLYHSDIMPIHHMDQRGQVAPRYVCQILSGVIWVWCSYRGSTRYDGPRVKKAQNMMSLHDHQIRADQWKALSRYDEVVQSLP